MNPYLLLWPMVIHALVTLYLYVPMSRARIRSVKEGGTKGAVYKLNREEPAESLLFTNAIRNQNEIGLLFYTVCLALYVTNGASYVAALLAWAFVVVKCLHVFVHVTTNNLRRRRPIFMVAFFIVILLWLVFAAHLAGLL
jgi:hypothetical protein